MIKYVHHDLNNVRTLDIRGWTGPREIIRHDPGEHRVTVSIPEREEDEYWTFSAPRNGILVLTGDPATSTDPLIVRIPEARFSNLRILFDGKE